MAIGFTDLTSTNRKPDKTMAASSTPNNNIANFGDGYEQRSAKGINNLAQEYGVSFANRTKEEIDDIVAFFVSKGGVSNFTFTIPDSNNSGETAIKVICDSWSQVYSTGDYYGCSANFRRVYEP
jgi:phage-related protein